MKKLLIAIFLISIMVLFGCVQQPLTPQPVWQPAQKPIEPANTKQLVEPPIEDLTKNTIEPEIRSLFDKAKEKTQSLHYTYKGPETKNNIYEVYARGNLVRIDMRDEFKDTNTYVDAYNAIYLDTGAKTADGYCDAQECIAKGRKRSLSYNEAAILTPLDWVEKITQAKKVSEEKIDNRKSWKLETNIGEVYVDSYSGIIQRIDSSERAKYEFIRIEQNAVKDEDIRPNI